MRDPYEIPWERLPPGFARGLEADPAHPPEPLPSATIVLLRDSRRGPEALLMKRRREAGFVPGAYVFPGGTVDEQDRTAAAEGLCAGIPAGGPDPAYWIAAVREAFEETGLLLATTARGEPVPPAAADPATDSLRDALLEDAIDFAGVLDALGARVDLSVAAYLSHWITPVIEPRRYETRFFIARVPERAPALADPREMVDAAWLTPRAALRRFREGALPMVFPTVRTLEDLEGFDSAGAAVSWARDRPAPTRSPRLVKTATGVTIRLQPEDEERT
ncbi:MAG TPA: NUDIX domain-containing protein [Longimicrobiales bacterium]|nr:NUDIX domain-containing protein [Longimicrobiales bacterium]